MSKPAVQPVGEESSSSVGLADERQTAEYIGDLLAQLERLARGQGLVRLQYLLCASREEAQNIADGAAASA